jgi:hypothetical protein
MRTIFFSRCSNLLHSPSPAAIREGCMQSTSEVVSTVSVKERLTRTTPNPRLPALNPVAKVEHGVLLVGRNTPWASPLFRLIAKCGAEPVFASPRSATSEYVRKSGHALVLLESSVPPEHRKQLVSDLLGSGVSLFYAYPVEIGCWWLPALLYGKDCHGSPAFRAREFPLELKRLLQEPHTCACSTSL